MLSVLQDKPSTCCDKPVLSDKIKVLGFGLTLTGNRLIDVILHIGAFSSEGQTFSQYIMPTRDISRGTTKAHGLRITTNFRNRVRVLRDVTQSGSLVTKTETSALLAIIDWVSKVKGEDSKEVGLALLFYAREGQPCLKKYFLEALHRSNLISEFYANCIGFVNGYEFIQDIKDFRGKRLTLTQLGLGVLKCKTDEEMLELGRNATGRAELTFKVIEALINDNESEDILSFQQIAKYSSNFEQDKKELEDHISLISKVLSIRIIFAPMLSRSWLSRNRAVQLRQCLINGGIDYEELLTLFQNGGKIGLERRLAQIQPQMKKKDLNELVDLILKHFENNHLVENSIPNTIIMDHIAVTSQNIKSDITEVTIDINNAGHGDPSHELFDFDMNNNNNNNIVNINNNKNNAEISSHNLANDVAGHIYNDRFKIYINNQDNMNLDSNSSELPPPPLIFEFVDEEKSTRQKDRRLRSLSILPCLNDVTSNFIYYQKTKKRLDQIVEMDEPTM